MTRRAMRDHRQAPAWPKRPVSSGRAMMRQFDDDIEQTKKLVRQFDLAMEYVCDRIMAVLRDLEDDELDRIDPRDPRINAVVRADRRKMFGELIIDEIAFDGETMIAQEQERRAGLTGHERIAETRERIRQKAVA